MQNNLPVHSQMSMDMQVKVLTTGNWPNDHREQNAMIVNLSKELNGAMNCFSQYYQHRFNNTRQLHWKLSLGHADLRSRLNSTTRYEFAVSTYQMCLLLLFNQH